MDTKETKTIDLQIAFANAANAATAMRAIERHFAGIAEQLEVLAKFGKNRDENIPGV